MKVIELRHCVLSIPGADICPAVIVYGGLYHLEGKWLLTKIPLRLQQNIIFVLPKHFTNSCTHCLEELHAKVDPQAIRSYSLCSYSRGGIEVYRYATLKEWRLLGLIDPSAPTLGGFTDAALDSFVNKIRCVYWVPNWGVHGYGGRVPRFAQHLRDLKVQMVEKPTHHFEMPAFFFSEFGTDFLS